MQSEFSCRVYIYRHSYVLQEVSIFIKTNINIREHYFLLKYDAIHSGKMYQFLEEP
jgi:hypothetical protein